MTIPWISDEATPDGRAWEEFYRNRWQHDKVVRSTHGVNCTGSCTWQIYVKNGIVTWEMQGLDYPSLEVGLPPYEPRGCQRGISYSWYLYSPLRVKYPYLRGALVDLWREARKQHDDPVEAWASIVDDPEKRKRFQRARGKGGFRRGTWDESLEIMAAANLHTIRKYGPDRIAGFSPIPAMSMISYASGARLMQLMGGVSLSFYDWYCDLPSASPEVWGEQTDVQESADWYNAKLLAVMGSNLNMTRTPDCHFAAEARHNGSKMWVFAPDFNQVAKYADEWCAINAGQDGAWWMAVNHVLLKEMHHEKQTPYFIEYQKKYTDGPYLVEIEELSSDRAVEPSSARQLDRSTARKLSYKAGRLLRANRLAPYSTVEHGEWKFLMWDETTQQPKMPMGSAGFRWGRERGKWNLLLEDGLYGDKIEPQLSFLEGGDEVVQVTFEDFGAEKTVRRGVPVKTLQLADGSTVKVATIYDILFAQYGVSRGLEGDYPADYDDETRAYTPAWQEKYTGLSRDMLLRFAREWGSTAELTRGKCTVIIGAGINHWYHANLMYRSAIHALVFAGCIGVNGGGLAHYVGQEKLAPGESWGAVAFGKDWFPPSRQMNAPSWHYVHSDQWRYERSFEEYHKLGRNFPENLGDSPLTRPSATLSPLKRGEGTRDEEVGTSSEREPGSSSRVPSPPLAGEKVAEGRMRGPTREHTIDHQVRAVRRGWLPFYPQFNQSSIELVTEAEKAGCKDEKSIVDYVVAKLKSGDLKFSVEDPDAPENWPRVWYIWRGNALMSSAKGHEYFLKHYLGTHTNTVSEDVARGHTEEVTWRDAPEGKMDLVVDLNFRMDTSALYSDIVLPAATWYEKSDINSTDMHSFIHPLSKAVQPCWESKSDWAIFRALARKFSEMASRYFDGPVREIVATPLAHDSAAEIAQSTPLDWFKGECEAIPGKTMPALKVVERDYRNVYKQFISFGPQARKNGLGAHGTHYAIDDFYDAMMKTHPTVCWKHEGTGQTCFTSNGSSGCERYPSLKEDDHTVDLILHLATVTNGELAWRSYKEMEAKVGLPLTHLAEKHRGVRVSYADLQSKPHRFVNSPMWSGLLDNGRAYSPFTYNVECLVPWRTLTGRQHLYLDHPTYIEFGEHLPTYKPKPVPMEYADLRFTKEASGLTNVRAVQHEGSLGTAVDRSTAGPVDSPVKMLNYLTPHGKWHIHSTYGDNQRMTTLSRGVEPFWMNDTDAEDLGINDNDWVEIFNDHGVVVTRAAVSHRIPRGVSIQYHSPERTYSVPKSPLRGNKRAGGHNSLTRTRLKPNLMIGGYGQFSYHFNYWGPIGCNRDTHVLVRKLPELRW